MTAILSCRSIRRPAEIAAVAPWITVHVCAAALAAGAQSVQLDVGNIPPSSGTETAPAAAAGQPASDEAATETADRHQTLQTELDRALQQSDFERALAIAGTLLAEDPLRMDMHRLRVGLLVETGDLKGARDQHRLMMQVFADDARALNELAWSLAAPSLLPIQARDLEVALAAAERAARLSERKDPAILDTLASVYHAIGLPERAVETQAEAMALAEGDPEIRSDLQAHMAYLMSAARARESAATGADPAPSSGIIEPAEPDPTPGSAGMRPTDDRPGDDGVSQPAAGSAGLISGDPAHTNTGGL